MKCILRQLIGKMTIGRHIYGCSTAADKCIYTVYYAVYKACTGFYALIEKLLTDRLTKPTNVSSPTSLLDV